MRGGTLNMHPALARGRAAKPLWGGPMNLFGLLFVFLLALALILLFLFWFAHSQGRQPVRTEPTRTVELLPLGAVAPFTPPAAL